MLDPKDGLRLAVISHDEGKISDLLS